MIYFGMALFLVIDFSKANFETALALRQLILNGLSGSLDFNLKLRKNQNTLICVMYLRLEA